MNSVVWFVIREERVWQYCPEFKCNLWVTVSRKQITPNRKNKESANKDYTNLGFKLRNGCAVQCNDEILAEKSWIRHIVQCSTVYK